MKKILILIALFPVCFSAFAQTDIALIRQALNRDSRAREKNINFNKKHGADKIEKDIPIDIYTSRENKAFKKAVKLDWQTAIDMCFGDSSSFGLFITVISATDEDVQILVSPFTCKLPFGVNKFIFKPTNNAFFKPTYNQGAFILNGDGSKRPIKKSEAIRIVESNSQNMVVKTYALGRQMLFKKILNLDKPEDLIIRVFKEQMVDKRELYGLLFNKTHTTLLPFYIETISTTGNPCNFGIAPIQSDDGTFGIKYIPNND